MQGFDRITQEPGMMGGKACIRGMRVTVGMIVGQIGGGTTSTNSSRIIPILSVKTFCRLCATPLGAQKNGKSI